MKKSEILKKAKGFLSTDFTSIYHTDGSERYRFMCICIDHAAGRSLRESEALKLEVKERIGGFNTFEEFLATQHSFRPDLCENEFIDELTKRGLSPWIVQMRRKYILEDMIAHYEGIGQ